MGKKKEQQIIHVCIDTYAACGNKERHTHTSPKENTCLGKWAPFPQCLCYPHLANDAMVSTVYPLLFYIFNRYKKLLLFLFGSTHCAHIYINSSHLQMCARYITTTAEIERTSCIQQTIATCKQNDDGFKRQSFLNDWSDYYSVNTKSYKRYSHQD